MRIELKQHWHMVDNTSIYTTGHYVVKKWEVRAMFKSDIFEHSDNLQKIENNEPVTSQLKSDSRISFSFIPFKDPDKYLMIGNASKIARDEINSILHFQIKRILVDKRLVKYNTNQ